MTRTQARARCLPLTLATFAAVAAAGPSPGDGNAAHGTFGDWLAATEISGELIYFQRRSNRHDVADGRRHTLRDHRTVQTRLDFASAYADNAIGIDIGLFSANDIHNCCAPDHEFNFVPWRNPWEADGSKRHARDGFSLHRAQIKLRRDGWWGKFGYYQPQGPGVLGVNWSILPGTLRGFEGGGRIGFGGGAKKRELIFAVQWANGYKAPWYRDVYHFRAADRERRVEDVYSFGVRCETTAGKSSHSAEVAWGEARGFLQNAHFKFKYRREFNPTLSTAFSYQLHAATDRVRGNDAGYFGGGRGWQHYLAWSGTKLPYTVKVEFTNTHAPSRNDTHLGYFVYRLSGGYGGANGAYEPWWDNRSDWNHNRESAYFVSIARNFDDVLSTPGFSAAISAVYGHGGQVYGISENLRESAWSIHFTYAVPAGPLKGTRASLHYTEYDNHTRLPSWQGFKNLFQDERDLKILVIVPWQG
jgi:hypothetical protein